MHRTKQTPAKPKRELNFVTLVSLVIGSQIGAGAFANPAALAQFKVLGLIGLLIAAIGAMSLSLVFSSLSSHLPKSGGPHVYVSEAFGKIAGFFTAWIYWIISWLSNAVLLSIIVTYLCIMTGTLSSMQIIAIESLIVIIITYINIVGVRFSGITGVVLTILKLIPFVVLPLIFLVFFKSSNFNFLFMDVSFDGNSIVTLTRTVLLGFFGFIGVECATAPAESVRHPKKTIPRALVIGTLAVASVYIVNIMSMVGVLGFDRLAESNAPYVTVMKNIFSNSNEILIAIIAIIVCVGALNAWTLTSGQIAYGAYEDGLFPKLFGKLNKAGAPVAALGLAALGMIICFFIQQSDSLKDGLIKLLSISVSIFFYVYLLCCVAYIKLIKKWKKTRKDKIKAYALSAFSIIFCIFVLAGDIMFESGATSLLVLSIFVILGIPVLLSQNKTSKKNYNIR